MIRRAHCFTHRRYLLSACARLILTLALLGSLSLVAWAQAAAARPNRGVAATDSYEISEIERVNLTNGNLNLSIPLASLPPVAGGKLGLTLSANYNSKMWDTVRREVQPHPTDITTRYAINQLQLSAPQPWDVRASYFITFEDVSWNYSFLPPDTFNPEYNLIANNRWSKVFLHTPGGAKHELRPKDYSSYANPFGNHPYLRSYYKDDPNTANASLRYYSFDGSYLWVKIDPSSSLYAGVASSWTLYLPDGTQVEQLTGGIQRITDTNGNKIKIWSETDVAGVSTTHYQDELTGREIKYVYDPAGNGGQGQGRSSIRPSVARG